MIDFSGANFTKIIKLTKKVEFKSEYPIEKLSEVCTEILAGGDVPKEKFSKEMTEEYKIPIFTNGTNENALYGYTNVARINKDSLTISARGSIGFCEIRKAPFYPAIRLIVATPNEEKILLEYLKISVSNSQIYSGGGIIKQLTVPMANNIEIPVPSIEEQKKIIAEFRAVDDEIKLQEKIIFDSDGEIKEKFSEMFSGIEEKISLEKLFQSIETGSRPQGGVSQYSDGILSLGGEHINNFDGHLNLENKKFVPRNFFEENILGRIEKNNILMCKDGALTGKIAIVRDELKDNFALANEHIFVMKNSDEVLQNYLFYYLFFEDGQQQIKNNITGMAQGGINRNNLKKILIPMPPKELQEKFAEYVLEVENKKITAQKKIDEMKLLRENLVKNIFGKVEGKKFFALK